MSEYPTTVSAWEAYALGLSRQELWRQGRAVNSFAFVKKLMADGFTMEEVHDVATFFVRAMVRAEMKLPEEGAFDMVDMADRDPLLNAEREP